MDIVHVRCAALDVSKKDAKVCVRVPGKRAGTYTSTVTTWGSTMNQILALREHLIEQQVTLVVMEATGVYWKPYVRHEARGSRAEVRGLRRWSVAAGW